MRWQRNFLTASQRTILFFVIVLSSLAGLSLWELKFLDSDRVFLVREDLWQARRSVPHFACSVTQYPGPMTISSVSELEADSHCRRYASSNESWTPGGRDYSIIAKGLIAGRNQPADVPTAIVSMTLLPWNRKAEKAIQIWRDSDRYTLRLIAIATNSSTPGMTRKTGN